MKRALFITILTWYYTCHGQSGNSFELTGSINRMSGMIKLYPVGNLSDYPDRMLFSDFPVVNGKFLIKGKVNYPTEVIIGLKVGEALMYISGDFFIEPGNLTILCNVDSLREIPGIRNASMSEYLENYRSLQYEGIDTIDDYSKWTNLKRIYLLEYAQKYPSSYVALWEISKYLKVGYNKNLDSAFGVLSKQLQISETGKSIHANLKQLKLTDTGRIFPDITVIDLEGKSHRLKYHDEKTNYILIDFWFSHCGPCLGQFPEYKKILDQYKNKGFKIIGISSDSSAADITEWKKVLKDNSLSWIQFRAGEETMRNLGIFVAPYNFILDESGKIVAKNLSTKEVLEFLQARLD